MKGDMFIPRGNNELNIESHIVGFDPEFIWLFKKYYESKRYKLNNVDEIYKIIWWQLKKLSQHKS